jgi:N-acetylneuraminic acid mutarotase
MNRFGRQSFFLFLLIAMASCMSAPPPESSWSRLPPIPDAQGFAGSFAGISAGALIVVGGANIVGDKWGTNFHKQWYDSVFVLESPRSQWRLAGRLPRPLGYGVSITTDDRLICIGGSDSTNHYADVFQISYNKRALNIGALPPLPTPCANCCGAKVGDTIYVAGGLETPTSTNAMRTFWALDLTTEKLRWRQLPAWPGPERMLAVAGVLGGEFYLFSGARLTSDANGKTVREYLNDAYAYSPQKGWRRISDVPRPVAAAPSPAISARQLQIVSGDDGSKVDLPPSPTHPGFSHDVFAYDAQTDRWLIAGSLPFGRATAPVVEWNGHAVVVMGEVRPRERTSEVWERELR